MTARLSIQLYTLREQAASGLAAVIERLGRAGYAGVEPAGFGDLSPGELRRCVADAGMVVSGMHVPMPTSKTANEILDAQEELGNDTLVVAYLPPEGFADLDALQRNADTLNRANERVRARGMRLGYHNHHFEFATRVEGRPAHELFFERLDDSILAEVDTYWAQVGGADPVDVVTRLGERASLLHIKDGPADDPASDMTAVGDGVVDVAGIARASRASWHVVELDRCATDMWEAVEQSARYLLAEGLAEGRP